MPTETMKPLNVKKMKCPVPIAPGESPRIRSEDLFGTRQTTEVLIEHGDTIYRLRRTRKGKLILHK